jgi:ethanolamine utilization protein EutA
MSLPPSPQDRSQPVTMIGLDFGSTTSSAMAATAAVGLSCATGRMEFGLPRVMYRSDPVFTPFNGQEIDIDRLDRLIKKWLTESGVKIEDLFAGGVIITGLAAKRSNAAAVARLVGRQIGETVVATADDPCLESWLAFMGSCSVLSRFHAEVPFVNIDIGGGTTNPALGINGNVLRTGCHFVGARHFQFQPGTYRLTGMSPYGRALLEHLGIRKDTGAQLAPAETESILDFYIEALEAIAAGNPRFFESPIGRLHQQVAFALAPTTASPVLVFSGGVGELVYRKSQGEDLPGATHYGDLGIDLAERILHSPALSAHVDAFVPENLGRATVYGLTLHSTEISGATIFLSSPELLPLRDLPIVARLPIDADAAQVRRALSLVETGPNGACIQLLPWDDSDVRSHARDTEREGRYDLKAIKDFARLLNRACDETVPRQPVVLLVPGNYGQVLGSYASRWRQSPHRFVVIDEIPDRQAHFVNIGRNRDQIVPVSFYGVC